MGKPLHVPEDLPEEVKTELRAGNKIAAIKTLRRLEGLSLYDAKMRVEDGPTIQRRARDPGTNMAWNKLAVIVFALLLGLMVYVALSPDVSFSDWLSDAPPIDRN